MSEDSEIIILTPETIPDYAIRTGKDEAELVYEYNRAYAKNQILYGYILKEETT